MKRPIFVGSQACQLGLWAPYPSPTVTPCLSSLIILFLTRCYF